MKEVKHWRVNKRQHRRQSSVALLVMAVGSCDWKGHEIIPYFLIWRCSLKCIEEWMYRGKQGVWSDSPHALRSSALPSQETTVYNLSPGDCLYSPSTFFPRFPLGSGKLLAPSWNTLVTLHKQVLTGGHIAKKCSTVWDVFPLCPTASWMTAAVNSVVLQDLTVVLASLSWEYVFIASVFGNFLFTASRVSWLASLESMDGALGTSLRHIYISTTCNNKNLNNMTSMKVYIHQSRIFPGPT